MLVRRLLVQLLRRKPCFEHRMARLLDERGHVDPHRTDQAATTAHIATVEQQVLPLPQLVRRDLTLQTQQPEQRGECARLALVSLLERFHLPDRCVLRILGRNIEMTGVSANAAMDAGLESESAERTNLSRKAGHGAGNACLATALLCGCETGAHNARGGAHEVAPLRASMAPLMARDGKI